MCALAHSSICVAESKTKREMTTCEMSFGSGYLNEGGLTSFGFFLLQYKMVTAADILRDPMYSGLSVTKILQKARADGLLVSDPENLKHREVFQVRKQIRVKRDEMLHITSPIGCFQIDVCMMPSMAAQNSGQNIFLAIEIPTRYVWAYPLKSQHAPELVAAFQKVLTDYGKPVEYVMSDDQFKARRFVEFLDSKGIQLRADTAAEDHISKGSDRLGLIDSLTKTLKLMIARYAEINRTVRWTSFLPDIVKTYNATPHSGIDGKTPAYMHAHPEVALKVQSLKRVENVVAGAKRPQDLVGKTVRIYTGKKAFQKSADPTWSRKLYVVVRADGEKYRVKEVGGTALIKRKLQNYELQVVEPERVVPSDVSVVRDARTLNRNIRRVVQERLVPRGSAAATLETRNEPRPARIAKPTAKAAAAAAAPVAAVAPVRKPRAAKSGASLGPGLVGRSVTAPGKIFKTTGSFPGRVTRVDPSHKDAVIVVFRDEPKVEYWFPAGVVREWV